MHTVPLSTAQGRISHDMYESAQALFQKTDAVPVTHKI